MTRVRLTVNGVAFRCPGCNDTHAIPIAPGGWGWNGAVERPTITPSIDVKAGHYASQWREGDACWCGKDYGFSCYRCHSTITDGRITFHPDSTHALSGQTVDLPDVVASMR